MAVQDEGSSTPNQIRLQIRASDLFVVGWFNVNENIYNRIESGTPSFDNCPPTLGDCTPAGPPRNTSYNGSYLELERRASARSTLALSPNAARQAVRDLSRSASTEGQEARSLIVLIQTISEVARLEMVGDDAPDLSDRAAREFERALAHAERDHQQRRRRLGFGPAGSAGGHPAHSGGGDQHPERGDQLGADAGDQDIGGEEGGDRHGSDHR
jgi:hypothetical protein